MTFLPWLRRGLAQFVGAPGASLPAQAQVSPFLTVNGTPLDGLPVATLRGPGAVKGISADSVRRVEPARGTMNFETNFFPLVEFDAPDLPWVFTPAGPGSTSARVAPWLCLVVVRVQDGVALTDTADASLPVLKIQAPAIPADELPDLTLSWAWAHVHSEVDLAEVESTVQQGSEEVLARLICPRLLTASKRWLACVVPAFDAGREAGLGRTFSGTTLGPAWSLSDTEVELPVYYSWTFETGVDGDFESLAMRLEPPAADETAVVGLRPMDVSRPGGVITDAPEPVLIDFQGAMRDPTVVPRPWDPAHQTAFMDEFIPWISLSSGRRVLTTMPTEDPVLTPPVYGAWQAGIAGLPDAGWINEINVDLGLRAAAGLGAEIVRRNQEALMSAAWNQLGEVRAAQVALNQARLQNEVGNRLSARVASLDDGTVLQATESSHAFIAGATGELVSQRLSTSQVPNGVLGHGFMRRTRTATPASRSFTQRGGSSGGMMAQLTSSFVKATSTSATASQRALLRFASAPAPAGMYTGTSTSANVFPSSVDVSGAANAVRSQLNQDDWIRASVEARIPAMADLLPPGQLPHKIDIGPQQGEPVGPLFKDPLFWHLMSIEPEFVLPGYAEIPDDTLRILEVNQDIVASILVGANHEMSRELLFREYPAAYNATYFHHFWESLDPTGSADVAQPIRDIDSIHSWTPLGRSLAEVGSGGTVAAAALLIKGELVRRFPSVVVYLARAVSGGGYDLSTVLFPSFWGSIGVDARFYGFDISITDAKGSLSDPGWYVVLEEPTHATRFGVPADTAFTHPTSGNSATFARDHHRPSFRVLRHANTLL